MNTFIPYVNSGTSAKNDVFGRANTHAVDPDSVTVINQDQLVFISEHLPHWIAKYYAMVNSDQEFNQHFSPNNSSLAGVKLQEESPLYYHSLDYIMKHFDDYLDFFTLAYQYAGMGHYYVLLVSKADKESLFHIMDGGASPIEREMASEELQNLSLDKLRSVEFTSNEPLTTLRY